MQTLLIQTVGRRHLAQIKPLQQRISLRLVVVVFSVQVVGLL